jgi:formate C-acetyltransferase
MNEEMIQKLVAEVCRQVMAAPAAKGSAPTSTPFSGAKVITDPMTMGGPSPRVQKKLAAFVNIQPEVCVERALLVTKAYQETEGLPVYVRRAHALETILDNMTIFIGDDELIVGNQCSKPRSSPIFPEFSCGWIEPELDTMAHRDGDAFQISEENKAALRAIFPYWKGKTNNELATNLMPPECLEAMMAGVYTFGNYYYNGVGHISVDYRKVLEKGLNGIIAEAADAKAKLDVADAEDLRKCHFLSSVITSCKAVIRFAARFAAEAEKQAAACSNSVRKAELAEIARICRKVPAEPAGSFHEACQAWWFTHLVIQIESNGHSVSPGRFDQYMYPHYAKDSSITVEKAQELVDLLFIKLTELNKIRDAESTRVFGGYPLFQNMIVGGVNRKGEDATNTISYICLQAAQNTKLYQPSLSVRIHENTPHLFYQKAAQTTRVGLGIPAYYNDRVIIPALLARGLAREDARDYAMIGCVEPQCGGKTEGWHDAAFFNLAKIVELAMNDGVCPACNKQLGPKTGHATSFTTFEQFKEAYTKQMEHFVRLLAIADNAVDLTHARNMPLPFLSCMVENCIGRGKSLQEGGAIYNFTGPQGVGVANAGDSLAAVKKLVFEDKALTMEQLKKAVDANFEGTEGEAIRQMLLNRAPKYGNDIDYVDQLARESAMIYCREVDKYHNPRGGQFQPGLYPASANVPMGGAVMATPDGRKAHTPLADGVSPSGGLDQSGPTASALSVAKLDHAEASNGTLLNMKFHPNAVKDERGLENLIAVTETLFTHGGSHVQYNVVSKETLLDAQKNPEEYRGLVVRVAGYSAFFTALDSRIQNDIIARTEQVF